MSENEDLKNLMNDSLDDDADTQKDKYLTFNTAGEIYALDIKYVIEIIGIQKITEIPDTEDYLKGVINLRGQVIPVIDVRIRFHIKEVEYGDRTCIIVVNLNGTVTGLIVDEVAEVLDIPEDKVDPPPKTSKGAGGRYISGLGKINNTVNIILDLDKLLNDDELESLNELSENEPESKKEKNDEKKE